MAYGTYDREPVDTATSDYGLNSAVALAAGTGAILTKKVREPRVVERFGFDVVTTLGYGGNITNGVLTLYKYPGGVSANKVALATIILEQGDLAGMTYFCDVNNAPVAAVLPYTGVGYKGIADLEPGDVVAIEITTQAVGSGYTGGTFQPFLCWRPRAEETQNETYVVDRTPVPTPVNNLLNPSGSPVTEG